MVQIKWGNSYDASLMIALIKGVENVFMKNAQIVLFVNLLLRALLSLAVE